MPLCLFLERDNRKKLLFDFIDDEAFDFELSDPPSSPPLPPFKSKVNVLNLANSGLSPIKPRRLESPR